MQQRPNQASSRSSAGGDNMGRDRNCNGRFRTCEVRSVGGFSLLVRRLLLKLILSLGLAGFGIKSVCLHFPWTCEHRLDGSVTVCARGVNAMRHGWSTRLSISVWCHCETLLSCKRLRRSPDFRFSAGEQ